MGPTKSRTRHGAAVPRSPSNQTDTRNYISRLPPEILSEIFTFCSPENEDEDSTFDNFNQMNWTLGRVCSR
ncbi:hypothetical protein PM082_023883 [Marasmius tenuissimus]|nr:hypothetical protein PM082_023883 [Marasmius tenuissimus]